MRDVNLLVLLSLIALAGCGQPERSALRITNTLGRGFPDAKEAGLISYRYAFSAQILDETTGNPVKNFSVSVAGEDASINTVVNALGDRNGLFHLSRDASLSKSLFEWVPAVITAPGFQPIVKLVEVGVDCHSVNCSSGKPTVISLKPLVERSGSSDFFLEGVTKEIELRGAPALFQGLLNAGKVDPRTSGLFARARTQDSLSRMLVVLNSEGTTDSAGLVSSLLAVETGGKMLPVGGDPVSTLAAAPKVGSAVVAVGRLLPYMGSISAALKDRQNSALGKAVGALVAQGNTEENVSALASALQRRSVQLAMPSVPVGITGLFSREAGPSANPFQNVLTSALRDPNFLALFLVKGAGGTKGSQFEMATTYLKPLLQGLVGKNAASIASLFNQLIARDGLMAIKEFRSLPDQEKFAPLLPYLDPIIRGLNSKDGTFLASQILPLIEQPNPAMALRELVTKGSGDLEMKARVAASLFPGVQNLLSKAVPSKQVFAAQLVQGLVSGELKGVSVTQDLPAASAVVLSGQAQDLFKISFLPNVQRVLWLP